MAFNRDAILRYIVAIHFICTSMVMLADWLPMSYTLSEMAILVLGLWAIVHRESVIQVELLMVIKFFSIILNIIAIGMYFRIANEGSRLGYHSYFVLSAFFAILLLMFKPAMLLLLNQVRKDRLGDATSPTFGGWGVNAGAGAVPEPVPVPGYYPVAEQQGTTYP